MQNWRDARAPAASVAAAFRSRRLIWSYGLSEPHPQHHGSAKTIRRALTADLVSVIERCWFHRPAAPAPAASPAPAPRAAWRVHAVRGFGFDDGEDLYSTPAADSFADILLSVEDRLYLGLHRRIVEFIHDHALLLGLELGGGGRSRGGRGDRYRSRLGRRGRRRGSCGGSGGGRRRRGRWWDPASLR